MSDHIWRSMLNLMQQLVTESVSWRFRDAGQHVDRCRNLLTTLRALARAGLPAPASAGRDGTRELFAEWTGANIVVSELTLTDRIRLACGNRNVKIKVDGDTIELRGLVTPPKPDLAPGPKKNPN